MQIVLELNNGGNVIVIETEGDGGGTIKSNLHDDAGDSEEYDGAMHGIESLVLALACAGVDVQTSVFKEALEGAIEACANNID